MKSVTRILMVLISVIALPISAIAVDFALNSETSIVGQDLSLGVSFSSVLEKDGDVVVVNISIDKKQIIAEINYKEKTVQIKSVPLEVITNKDLADLKSLYSSPSLYPLTGKVGEALIRTLNFLLAHPPNEVIDIDTSKGSDMNGKKIDDLSTDPSTDTQQQEGIISLCNQIGQSGTGKYSFNDSNRVALCISKTTEVGPCAKYGDDFCMGRCGAGCDKPGIPLDTQYTLDCFIHDLCTRDTGQISAISGPCKEEFDAAADDYFFAPDCFKFFKDCLVTPPGQCTHSECVTGAALTKTCSTCATTVCNADAYCCSNNWDGICVNEAKQLCGSTCP